MVQRWVEVELRRGGERTKRQSGGARRRGVARMERRQWHGDGNRAAGLVATSGCGGDAVVAVEDG